MIAITPDTSGNNLLSDVIVRMIAITPDTSGNVHYWM